jgi:hypothetical protein
MSSSTRALLYMFLYFLFMAATYAGGLYFSGGDMPTAVLTVVFGVALSIGLPAIYLGLREIV